MLNPRLSLSFVGVTLYMNSAAAVGRTACVVLPSDRLSAKGPTILACFPLSLVNCP
jgi:hypothetical protein